MARRARGLTAADQALWANYVSELVPLRGRAGEQRPDPIPTARQAPQDSKARPRSALLATKPRMMASPVAVGDKPGGIDSATWHRFRTGKLTATRKLDLQSMTAQRAFHALVSFLRTAHAEQVTLQDQVLPPGGHRVAAGTLRDHTDHGSHPDRVLEHVDGLLHAFLYVEQDFFGAHDSLMSGEG